MTGVKMMSIIAGIKLLEGFMAQGGELGDQPLAILVPPTDKEALDRLDALQLSQRFRPLTITELPIKYDTRGDTRRPTAIMFQLGDEDIAYYDNTTAYDFQDKFLAKHFQHRSTKTT